jgi:hypothetical protein
MSLGLPMLSMTDEEIERFWQGSLRTLEPELVHRLPVDPRSKKLFCNLGMPSSMAKLQDVLALEFYFDEGKLVERQLEQRMYLEFGTDGGGEFLLDQQTGVVFATVPHVGASLRYVNRNVECLLQSLTAFGQSQTLAVGNPSGNKYQSLVDALKRELVRIDPRSLGSDHTWWDVVLIQP